MTDFTVEQSLKQRLCDLIENEARSCSMDFGCITPEYVCRMWGGQVSKSEIKEGLNQIGYHFK